MASPDPMPPSAGGPGEAQAARELGHRMRGALGAIRTAARVLRSRAAADPALEEVRGIIERQAESLATMVDELVGLVRDPVAGDGPPPVPRARPAVAIRHVLVIDDDARDRFLFAAYLEAEGFRVSQAAGGEEGVALAGDLRPDAVLIDGRLADIPGEDVAARLRQALGDAVFLVALTGMDGEDPRARSLAAVVDAFVVKSADPAELVGVLGGGRP